MPSGVQISSCRNCAIVRPSDPAQDLAVDVAVVERVIGRALTDRKHRLQRGDAAAHTIPVRQPVGRVADRRLRHTRLVRQRMAKGGGLLAVLPELRPHLHDRHVVTELVLLDEQVHARGGDALRRRRQHEHRVAVDRRLLRFVSHAGPGVDDELAVQVGGDLQPDLGACRPRSSRARRAPCRWRRWTQSAQLPLALRASPRR